MMERDWRGFSIYAHEIPVHPQGRVHVKQSSLADSPHVWIFGDGCYPYDRKTPGEPTLQFSRAQAIRLAHALLAFADETFNDRSDECDGCDA